MEEKQELNIKILTCNAAGGKPKEERSPEILGEFIKEKEIDFVFLQELAELDKDSVLDEILTKTNSTKYKGFFIPTVNTSNHPCPKKVKDTDRNGKWYSERFMHANNTNVIYAAQGNGFILNKERWEHIDLWKGDRTPTPASFQISEPSLFLGDRETEPRCMVLIRVKLKDTSPNFDMLIGCTHLTVLREESEVADKAIIGSKVRQKQVEYLMQITEQLPAVPFIMAGDFNAELCSSELSRLNKHFLAVTDFCSSEDKQRGTHKKHKKFIDHIWCYPDKLITVKKCSIVDELEEVSDHRPIYAELALKEIVQWSSILF